MTEATQTANPTDARQASMSRVQTQETILASLAPQAPASGATDGKPEGEAVKDEGETKAKKTPQERIQELANKRREAEAKADAAERKAAELEARLQSLQAQAKPLEVDARPMRSQFTTEDDYVEALSDWKTKKAIAEREQQQAQARVEAEEAELASQWTKRQEVVMKQIPDYAEVLGKSEISIPNHIHRALVESEFKARRSATTWRCIPKRPSACPR
jgi:chromosome segregation ATPase